MAIGYHVLPDDLYVWLKKMLFKKESAKRKKVKAWNKKNVN